MDNQREAAVLVNNLLQSIAGGAGNKESPAPFPEGVSRFGMDDAPPAFSSRARCRSAPLKVCSRLVKLIASRGMECFMYSGLPFVTTSGWQARHTQHFQDSIELDSGAHKLWQLLVIKAYSGETALLCTLGMASEQVYTSW